MSIISLIHELHCKKDVHCCEYCKDNLCNVCGKISMCGNDACDDCFENLCDKCKLSIISMFLNNIDVGAVHLCASCSYSYYKVKLCKDCKQLKTCKKCGENINIKNKIYGCDRCFSLLCDSCQKSKGVTYDWCRYCKIKWCNNCPNMRPDFNCYNCGY